MPDIILHGHFYQPPREEPWLELVSRELSAAPDHDWNERISRECYAPLARGRVLDEQGRLARVINAYEWLSFNVGPTLFRWLDHHAPEVVEAIIAGDRASLARTGHGNALAMPFHHAIMPLLSRRDKITEVRWGVRDFQMRLGREPEGMWLPETAVDEETLTVLADERIRFTVLAPGQVEGWPPFGRPGRWRAGGGREVALFVYDGPAAHNVAFSDALADATRWEEELTGVPLANEGGATFVTIATDGETFGHHHRFGDLALAAVIDRISRRSDAAFTNFGAALKASPPQFDLKVVSPSSWSCPHGVDRWRKACGCHFKDGTQQEWRAPLRDGLETLYRGITEVVLRNWPAAGGDMWTAREVAGPDLSGALQLSTNARVLLEIEQHALRMFTSCAWFFDDIGRLEPKIVLRHAAYALGLLPPNEAERLEAALVATLAQGISNDPEKGSGADIWHRDVLPGAGGPANLAAGLAALRELAPDALDDVKMPTYTWRLSGDDIVLIHSRTGQESTWHVETVNHGVVAVAALVQTIPGTVERIVTIGDYPEPIRGILRQVATPLILDAALPAEDAAAVRAALLDRATIRNRALAGAWRLVALDGLEEAGIVVHSAIDLFAVDNVAVGDTEQADAFVRLAAQPPSAMRESLVGRFGIA